MSTWSKTKTCFFIKIYLLRLHFAPQFLHIQDTILNQFGGQHIHYTLEEWIVPRMNLGCVLNRRVPRVVAYVVCFLKISHELFGLIIFWVQAEHLPLYVRKTNQTWINRSFFYVICLYDHPKPITPTEILSIKIFHNYLIFQAFAAQ